jgi:hypothetical protein
MLETHIVMCLLIFCLILILVFRLALTLMVHLALLVMPCLISLMDSTIALSLHALVMVHRGSRSTQPNGEVQRIVKTSSGRIVKCWIPTIYLTNPSIEPSTSSHPM